MPLHVRLTIQPPSVMLPRLVLLPPLHPDTDPRPALLPPHPRPVPVLFASVAAALAELRRLESTRVKECRA